MAIKRKTISIKRVKLVKPKYMKPIPLKISSIFTEPVRIPDEDIKVKKKRKNQPSQKAKKTKVSRQVHKGPLILTSKSIQKLRPKEKQKKKRKAKAKKTPKISTFDSAFPKVSQTPYEEPKWSEDTADWVTVRDSIVNQFINSVDSIVSMGDESSKRPLKVGADYAIREFMNIPGIENDDLLGNFLIENPITSVFDNAYQALYDAGIYFLSDGRKLDTVAVDSGIETYANMISGILLAEMADGDYMDEI